ncbi:GTP cyclohydrolase II RibA [Vibrio sp. SCSIO 43136]|uniref:GTP cyclohydrolase II RibA n=1 Tax=Vibrio sp. SCSIO 43136 TaxID=2819101 RepID=UPI0020753927|nr:GTP cyclohydrolase II RibA [Vibrio sp. SCSIO 43136]USD67359.1 GTP cyclohydrolase II RibA [Vibrio sp. SCSIO 43136]
MKIRQSVVIPITNQKIPATFYSFDAFDASNEHLLIVVKPKNGKGTEEPILRIHSECLTGDVFQSSRCDCGPQLYEALDLIAREGGIIAYLRQEGRGIGLYNKLEAYKLQDQGHDTYDANRLLGFGKDLRSFDMVAGMLKAINVKKVRLLSNNPKKLKALSSNGIEVTNRISTSVFITSENKEYLQAKELKDNHIFSSPIPLN